MTYRISEDGPRPGGCYEVPVWQVERVFDGGEVYLLGTFETSEAAVAALSMLSLTREARLGAKVDFGAFTT